MTDLSLLQPLVDQNLDSIRSFRPEALLTAGTMLLFVLDLFWKKDARRVSFLTIATLLVLGGAAVLLAAQPTDTPSLFNGMLANDSFATFFKWLFLGAGALTVLIAAQGTDFPSQRIGEFYALLVAIVLGMFLMASATDLLMMYLAIELVSMVSYVLAGFKKGDRKAAEGSLKYVIYGGVASGVMLFGMSYLYGLTGTTSLHALGPAIQALSAGGAELVASKIALVVGVVFVAAGMGYKVAAVPFHMWCPDVYEGAPTPFTAFLSVGPKAAGFALALRFFLSAFAGPADPVTGFQVAVGGIPWPAVIGIVAAVTMTLGNLTALSQTNLKRLLAYSSIAHAGYALMGLAASSQRGIQAVMIYMLVYVVMNLGAFLVVIWVAENTGSESILDYKGLARRQPVAAVTFAVFLFSLTGLPPFAGFAGKWYLFYAVFERIGTSEYGVWYGALALIGALNTAVALYYYVRIVRAMFIDAPYAAEPAPFRGRVGYQLLLGGFTAAILVFGLWWTPFVDWTAASLTLFRG